MPSIPCELIINILSFNHPSLSYFITSRLFNKVSKITYQRIVQYHTQRILLRFYYNQNEKSSQFYKFVSWNEYRRYKSYNKLFFNTHTHTNDSIYFQTEVNFEKTEDKEIIEFAKKNPLFLNYKEIEFEYVLLKI